MQFLTKKCSILLIFRKWADRTNPDLIPDHDTLPDLIPDPDHVIM